jgi:hypothetical protein
MSDADIEILSITRAEYSALNYIEGLNQDAFYMVVQAKEDASGRYILRGTPATFDALEHDLFDEIDAELSPPSRLKHLRKLYLRLVPESDEV